MALGIVCRRAPFSFAALPVADLTLEDVLQGSTTAWLCIPPPSKPASSRALCFSKLGLQCLLLYAVKFQSCPDRDRLP
eukprot:1155365-Pelagomonas_calceolata.AAC.6